MNIQGAKAVVTGGASGIGRALAEALAARGARVLVADIDGARARSVAEAIGHATVGAACDVRDHASVVALAAEAETAFGGADLVFANAGVGVSGPLLDAAPEAFDWIFDVNVKGMWNTASVFGRRMRDSGRSGHICLTGSEHSLGFQHAGMGFYTATKHAVLGLAAVMRAELPASIGVSILCPGLVNTELHLSKRAGPLPQDDPATLAFAGAVMDRGMSAKAVAEAALAGVERGDFFIVTHPAALAAAKRRYEELDAAFAAQAPMTPDSSRLEVNAVIAAAGQDFAARAAVESAKL